MATNKPTLSNTLQLSPRCRIDIQDLSEKLVKIEKGALSSYENILFCSLHTTAGFLEQSFASKLGAHPEGIEWLVRSAHRLFPEGAPYWHDQMDLRSELTSEQRKSEPLNADSHLAFICLGLSNCVLYKSAPETPTYFIDLDGEFRGTLRSRKSIVVGYNNTECVYEETLSVPMPDNSPCTLDLSKHLNHLHALVAKHRIHRGLVSIELASDEKYAGITVNEFETLLVERDIIDVLLNPVKYMLQNGPQLARNPLDLPNKAKNVLTYETHLAIRDGLRLASRSVSAVEYMTDRLGIHLPLLESVIDKLATPLEARWMNLGSTARFLINSESAEDPGQIVMGTYQSPILIQWRSPESDVRRLHIRLLQFS